MCLNLFSIKKLIALYQTILDIKNYIFLTIFIDILVYDRLRDYADRVLWRENTSRYNMHNLSSSLRTTCAHIVEMLLKFLKI